MYMGHNLVFTPYLSDTEEKELVIFLKQESAIGYGKTKKETTAMVQQTNEEKKNMLHDS